MGKSFEDFHKEIVCLKESGLYLPEDTVKTLAGFELEDKQEQVIRIQLLIDELRLRMAKGSLSRDLLDILERDFNAVEGLHIEHQVDSKSKKAISLVELCYTSKTVEPFTDENISKLLEIAAANNLKNDISSFLFYNEQQNTFIHIIEGDERAVRRLMGKISKDIKHSEIILRSKYQIRKRSFGSFPMLFRSDEQLRSSFDASGNLKAKIKANLGLAQDIPVSKSMEWTMEKMCEGLLSK